MFITGKSLPRRTFLRGVGTAVALPFLDAMTPALVRAQGAQAPVRMAFVYVPNGMDMRNWNPDYEGALGVLPPTLQPLDPFKRDLTLLGNLTHNTGRALLDGAGDHGRCSGSYLTDGFKIGDVIRLTAGAFNALNTQKNLLIIALTATVATVRVVNGSAMFAEANIASATVSTA